jgi:hypothetical protein
MLSPLMRAALLVLGVVYGVLGLILFLFPSWASSNFAWPVSPFVAMTMGGWCLGNAWCALMTWRRPWTTGVLAIFYLGLFGLLEAGVLYAFRANLTLATPLAWLYVATIGLTVLFAIVAVIEFIRVRPVIEARGRPLTRIEFGATLLFTVAVALLGLYVLNRPVLQYAVVFPEPLSLFTLRGFGALYFSIAVATVPLLLIRGLDNLLAYSVAMYGLILFITLAALVFVGRFDFATYPGQAAYIAAYVAVGIFVAVKVAIHGTGTQA